MTYFSAFGLPVNTVVVGASGGIGHALVAALLADDGVAAVHAFSRQAIEPHHAKLKTGHMDILDEAQIAAAANHIAGDIHVVLVATGLLHDAASLLPEKSWRAISADALARSYAVNAIGPALVAKHFLPRLPRQGRAIFAALSARVGSISDNNLGGWYSYRAAKAALNQLIRTLSRELAQQRKDAICVGLHPGTVDTPLSKPFQQKVAADRLFAAPHAADCLLRTLGHLSPAESGGLFAWDGTRIPY